MARLSANVFGKTVHVWFVIYTVCKDIKITCFMIVNNPKTCLINEIYEKN